MTVQSDQPRGTKCDQRPDTKEEPAVRRESLSVDHVTPTPDPVFQFMFTPVDYNDTDYYTPTTMNTATNFGT